MAKILVVDDEKPTIELLSKVLENEGYSVITAYNGTECVEQLEKVKTKLPDLIVLDIMMPQLSGWDVAAILKNHKAYEKIPIIFLTAKCDLTSKSMGRFTSEHYIEKPFVIDDLLEKIAEVIKRKKKNVKITKKTVKKITAKKTVKPKVKRGKKSGR